MAYWSFSPPPPDITLRTKWYVLIRWFILSAIAIPTVVSQLIASGINEDTLRDTLIGVLAISTNIIFYLAVRLGNGEQYFKRLAALLLGFDIALITAIIFFKGGIESRSVILYVLPIILSAAIFGRRTIYYVAGAAALLYNTLLVADYVGLITSLGAFNPELRKLLPFVVNSSIFFTLILFTVAIIVDFITRIGIAQERYAGNNLEGMRRAQEIAHMGNWEWDLRGSTIVLSDELRRILGIPSSLEQVTVENIFERIALEDRRKVRRMFRRARTRSRTFSIDYRVIYNQNGDVRYIHTEGESVASADGRVTKLIGTAQDVTDVRKLDAAKSEFVSLASHQLRTPATGVKQYIGILLEGFGGKLTNSQRELLQTAYECNERQIKIIDDILYVAQLDSGSFVIHPAEANVINIAKRAVNKHQKTFEAHHQRLVMRTKFKRLITSVDEARLGLVIENLLDNALKFSAKGKQTTVRIRRVKDKICIAIADQGVGIAQEDLPKVFRRFSRIDNPVSVIAGGTGLSLYWTSKVIDLHHGTIEVDSKPGKGTTFNISLPVS